MSKLHFRLVSGKWFLYNDRPDWWAVTIGNTPKDAWRKYKAYKGLK